MFVRSLAAIFIIACCATAGRAETLNLLIWESYIDPAILAQWTAKTGVTVRQTVYDSGDARDEILSDPNSGVDLAVVGENSARLFGRKGVLEPITSDNVPSADEYLPAMRDRCSAYGVPYLWGTMGILYRTDKVAVAPISWNDLMRPVEALKGHIAMFDDHNETFTPPLVLLGKSLNATDTPTMKAAFELLKTQAPYVRTYDYVLTSTQNQEDGPKLYMALGYSGDQHVLNARSGSPGTWRYVAPSEGSLFWLDCLGVVSTSPRKALALDLLNHIASAPSALANAAYLTMPTANQKALALVPEATRSDPEIYPPQEMLAKSQAQQELSPDAIQTRRRIINSLANFRETQ